LIIIEVTDSKGRFKPDTKYKGMAKWDDEEGDWRVVVNLKWCESKVPAIPYGNKEGCSLCV
jgi:hypothetical protein